jgi:hypothetical protein
VKRLIFVPVIHTAADLGSLAAPVRARYQRELGDAAWNQREQAVERLWDTIRRRIADLRLDYGDVLIYQDGLPVCEHELEIVRELAGAGSRNHQLILDLVGRGAVLMGTEDPQLLIREYQLQRARLEPQSGGGAPAASPDEAAEVLALRDRAIARRIAETLQDGQVGLLFLGAAHRLDDLRAQDIEVEPLL